MEEQKIHHWFQKVGLKDQKEISQHKQDLIKKIKTTGVSGLIKNSQKIENKLSIWKRIKKFLSF